MDNFRASIASEGYDQFVKAMEIFFHHAPGNSVIAWRIDDTKGLILYWTAPKDVDVTMLPYKMNLRRALEFCWGWLEQAPLEEEPDHDGDNSRGFLLYNEAWGNWGYAIEEWEAFVAMKPIWSIHGK